MPLWLNDLLAATVFIVFTFGVGLAYYSIIKCGVPGCWRMQGVHLLDHKFVCDRHWEVRSQRGLR